MRSEAPYQQPDRPGAWTGDGLPMVFDKSDTGRPCAQGVLRQPAAPGGGELLRPAIELSRP